MKPFFALYDKHDNFLNCGFSRAELEKDRPFGSRIFNIRIDIKEDKDFIEENKEELITIQERAKQQGVSERTIYRRNKSERV